MEKEIQKLLAEAEAKLESVQDANDLNSLYVELFGKNSPLVALTKKIPHLPAEERKQAGKAINQAKQDLENLYQSKRSSQTVKHPANYIDVTAPGKKRQLGHLHLVSQAIEEIVDIFTKLGFSLQSYPEIDWDWYAFESLNMPNNHPARDDWETFFIRTHADPKYGRQVLTPHTSNGQVREMEEVRSQKHQEINIRMINISRCYRRQIDVSHTPMFHQFEGLVLGKDISIANLRGTLDFFTQSFFGKDRITRLRPHHFRFTEPSFEVDVTCGICKGQGCRLCKDGWLELGGAGMVHPNVLLAGKIDPKIYSGFAFGWGVERTIAMKKDLPDTRLLYQNDLRFLEQF